MCFPGPGFEDRGRTEASGSTVIRPSLVKAKTSPKGKKYIYPERGEGERAAASMSICLGFRASVPGAVPAPNIYRGSGCLLAEATEASSCRIRFFGACVLENHACPRAGPIKGQAWDSSSHPVTRRTRVRGRTRANHLP